MKKKDKPAVSPKVYELYDDYAHNRIDRRSFMSGLSAFAVGGLTVPSLLSFLMPDYEQKIQVKAEDDRLKSEFIT